MAKEKRGKMLPQELEMWIAYRKKCHAHDTKKNYDRKKFKKVLTSDY